MPAFFKSLIKDKVLWFMVLPGTLWFLIFCYLPMFGTVIAFKDFKIHRDGFFASVLNSKWVGLENFNFCSRRRTPISLQEIRFFITWR